MAQLRQDYHEFLKRQTVILVIGPENQKTFKIFWKNENLPFIGLPDPEHKVLKRYGQQVKIFKFGRMPAQMIVDKSGTLRFVHYGQSMSDIPSNKEIFGLIDSLNG